MLKKLQKILSSITYVDFNEHLVKKFNEITEVFEHIQHKDDFYLHKDYDKVEKVYQLEVKRLQDIKKDFIWTMFFNFCQTFFIVYLIMVMSCFIALNYLPKDSIFSYLFIWFTWSVIPFYILGKINYDTNQYFKNLL